MGYAISSPFESDGSGELKSLANPWDEGKPLFYDFKEKMTCGLGPWDNHRFFSNDDFWFTLTYCMVLSNFLVLLIPRPDVRTRFTGPLLHCPLVEIIRLSANRRSTVGCFQITYRDNLLRSDSTDNRSD